MSLSHESSSSYAGAGLLDAAKSFQSFVSHPDRRSARALAEQSPGLRPQISEVLRSRPEAQQERDIVLTQYGQLVDRLGGYGRYLIEVTPTEVVPESGEAWAAADGLLGGEFRGGDRQEFVIEAREQVLRIKSVRGKAAIDLALVDYPRPYGMHVHTFDHDRDNRHIDRARGALQNKGPFVSTEVFLDVVSAAVDKSTVIKLPEQNSDK